MFLVFEFDHFGAVFGRYKMSIRLDRLGIDHVSRRFTQVGNWREFARRGRRCDVFLESRDAVDRAWRRVFDDGFLWLERFGNGSRYRYRGGRRRRERRNNRSRGSGLFDRLDRLGDRRRFRLGGRCQRSNVRFFGGDCPSGLC